MMSLPVLRARWILPVAAPPMRDAWVSVHGGRIVAVGTGASPGPVTDLGDVALLPGLVNAHTHLELSWMAGLVPPATSMPAWIRTLLRTRGVGPAGGEDDIVTAMEGAVAVMRATGTVLVGDVSNSLASAAVLKRRGYDAAIFHEILGFDPLDPKKMVRDARKRLNELVADSTNVEPNQLRAHSAVVAHAPYSTAPELFTEIATRHDGLAPLSVHLAESQEEVEFLHTGSGPMRALLDTLGVWNEAWQVPRCGPVEYLRRIGYLLPGTLLVHGVHLTMGELDQARDADAVIVTCPRSNVWVGGGIPPVSRFYGSGVPVAIGTDSLASTDTLNMFDELAALRRLAPEVDAARLLDSATRVGAEALGFGQHYGTITAGRRAAFASVRLPAGIGARSEDVEEYLVSGVSAAAIVPVGVPAA